MSEIENGSSTNGTNASSQMQHSGGGRRSLYYAGPVNPMYYGGGAPGAYGVSSYGEGGGGEDESSLMGSLSIMRMFRVCTQRWVTIMVFVIVGAVVSLAVFKISPEIYEAGSLLEMNPRRPILNSRFNMDVDVSSSLDEVFNTRLARLRSRAMFEQVLRQYRTDYPSSTATDKELVRALMDSKMTLVRRSRLIQLSARSPDPQLATDLVNAYSKTAEVFTADLNKNKSENAVSWLRTATETARRELERVDKEMLDFRFMHQLDFMASEIEIARHALMKVTIEISDIESDIIKSSELLKTLELIQNDPERFGALPESVPRSLEIGASYQMLQKTLADKNSLLARFTANHPDVKVKEKEAEVYTQQFADVVFRALETCKANLDLKQRQLALQIPKRDELTQKLLDTEAKIVPARMKLEQMERAREVGDINYKALLQRRSDAHLAADENTAIIEVVELAVNSENPKPVLPNPLIIFPAGPALGLILGVLFVLILDHLEDKIAGISDIEHRLRLKTLAVLPHVRRKKREQLARLVSEDEFSQFSEAVAGLRNLLDSPRYQEMSKVLLCMSTQPGEGKTVTSCSLAASCAQSGQRTLLVDFDMRRPRLATIFEKKSEDFNSLPHILSGADASLFDTLPTPSGIKNLDVILSKASLDVSPSSLMGSGLIVEFFTWARNHYDRIVIDSPPFGVVGDVMTLASLVDSVMIMCCPDRTRFQLIKHASRNLTESGARVIGVIVNDVDFGRSAQFGRYDYRYARYTSRGDAYFGYSKKQGAGKAALKKDAGKTARSVEQSAASTLDKPAYGDDLTPEKQSSRQDVVDVSMMDDE